MYNYPVIPFQLRLNSQKSIEDIFLGSLIDLKIPNLKIGWTWDFDRYFHHWELKPIIIRLIWILYN